MIAGFIGGPLNGQQFEVGDPPPLMIDAEGPRPLVESADLAALCIVRYWRCHDGWYRYPRPIAGPDA